MKGEVVSEINKDLAKRTVNQAKKNFDNAEENINTAKKIQKMLLIGLPVALIAILTGVSIFSVIKLKNKENKALASEMATIAKQIFAEITFLPVPPQPLSFIWKGDKTAILELSKKITDIEALQTSYKSIYSRDVLVDVRKVLDDGFSEFETNYKANQKKEITDDVTDTSTNKDAEIGSSIITLKETKLYKEADVLNMIKLKGNLKALIGGITIPAKNIIKDAEYSGEKISVNNLGTGTFLDKVSLVRIKIERGLLFFKKTGYFYVRYSEVKLYPSKEAKDLNYTNYEIPESYLV